MKDWTRNETGVTMGHWPIVSKDVDVRKRTILRACPRAYRSAFRAAARMFRRL